MKTKIATFLMIAAVFFGSSVSGQWYNTYIDDHEHNHFSIEEIDDDIVVAGTVFDGGLANPKVQVMRLDNGGSVIWEQAYDLGADERCFDIVVRDSDRLAVTGYVQPTASDPPRIFVMVLDANVGIVLDYKEYTIYDESTGLNIIYSPDEDAYYVAGYESADILHLASDKQGFVMSIDASTLNVNWAHLIIGLGNDHHRNMANKLREIPGVGIFVTGSVNNDPPYVGASSVSTLRLMLDYNGGTFWDLTAFSSNSFECGADAVYRPHDDALFVLSNNSAAHTFEIHRIDNASSPSPSVSIHRVNDLPWRLGVDVAGLSIKLDPVNPDEDDQHLIVGGMMRQMYWNNNLTNNSPSFIAKIDPHTFDVVWFRYIEVDNLGYSSHDHDVFRAFFIQQPLIHYPDILAVFEENFFLLGYATTVNVYNLTVAKTDLNGHTRNVQFDCEVSVTARGINTSPTPTGMDIFQEAVNEIPDSKTRQPTFHNPREGCNTPDPDDGRKRFLTKSTGPDPELKAFQVYPNPVAEVLYIEIPLYDKAMQVDLQIFDAMGKAVIQRNGFYQPGSVEQIDISSLPNGIYFLSGNAGAHKVTKSIIIAH
jgi:hypothetical protein